MTSPSSGRHRQPPKADCDSHSYGRRKSVVRDPDADLLMFSELTTGLPQHVDGGGDRQRHPLHRGESDRGAVVAL